MWQRPGCIEPPHEVEHRNQPVRRCRTWPALPLGIARGWPIQRWSSSTHGHGHLMAEANWVSLTGLEGLDQVDVASTDACMAESSRPGYPSLSVDDHGRMVSMPCARRSVGPSSHWRSPVVLHEAADVEHRLLVGVDTRARRLRIWDPAGHRLDLPPTLRPRRLRRLTMASEQLRGIRHGQLELPGLSMPLKRFLDSDARLVCPQAERQKSEPNRSCRCGRSCVGATRGHARSRQTLGSPLFDAEQVDALAAGS